MNHEKMMHEYRQKIEKTLATGEVIEMINIIPDGAGRGDMYLVAKIASYVIRKIE